MNDDSRLDCSDMVKPFKCCGAGDPPCVTFDESCQNPANYADGESWCPKCKQPDFPFCATSGCLNVPKIQAPAPNSEYSELHGEPSAPPVAGTNRS